MKKAIIFFGLIFAIFLAGCVEQSKKPEPPANVLADEVKDYALEHGDCWQVGSDKYCKLQFVEFLGAEQFSFVVTVGGDLLSVVTEKSVRNGISRNLTGDESNLQNIFFDEGINGRAEGVRCVFDGVLVWKIDLGYDGQTYYQHWWGNGGRDNIVSGERVSKGYKQILELTVKYFNIE